MKSPAPEMIGPDGASKKPVLDDTEHSKSGKEGGGSSESSGRRRGQEEARERNQDNPVSCQRAAATAGYGCAEKTANGVQLFEVERITSHSIHSQCQTIDSDKPPVMGPDWNSKIPKDSRQKALTKYYEEFRRIYGPILDKFPSLAHEHAFKCDFYKWNMKSIQVFF